MQFRIVDFMAFKLGKVWSGYDYVETQTTNQV